MRLVQIRRQSVERPAREWQVEIQGRVQVGGDHGPKFLERIRWRSTAPWRIGEAGTTVVLDNLSVHRSPAVRTVIEAAGCHLRSSPAYSPDVNPIELFFAKLKTHLRGVAARTLDPLVNAIGSSLDRITRSGLAGSY